MNQHFNQSNSITIAIFHLGKLSKINERLTRSFHLETPVLKEFLKFVRNSSNSFEYMTDDFFVSENCLQAAFTQIEVEQNIYIYIHRSRKNR